MKNHIPLKMGWTSYKNLQDDRKQSVCNKYINNNEDYLFDKLTEHGVTGLIVNANNGDVIIRKGRKRSYIGIAFELSEKTDQVHYVFTVPGCIISPKEIKTL